MESEPLLNLINSEDPSLSASAPRAVEVLQTETTSMAGNRLLMLMNPTVKGTKQGK